LPRQADLVQVDDIHWSDLSEDARRHDLPTLIGDPVKDAERLQQASPLKRVAEIKAPVFPAHGVQDRRVPVAHADAFVSAARDAGVDLTVQMYPEDGHGFFWPAHQADHDTRLAAFLAKSLGGGAAAARPADQNRK
jgi:dipeptidyl aminopeptidase/acylaminoacyl peptidase